MIYLMIENILQENIKLNCILWVCLSGRNDFFVNHGCCNQKAVTIGEIISEVII